MVAIEVAAAAGRLIARALAVVEWVAKKVARGVDLKGEERRAGELAAQAIQACIADPSNTRHAELLIEEAERVSPHGLETQRDLQPRRDPQDRAHEHRRHAPSPARGENRSGRQGGKGQTPQSPVRAKVTIKKRRAPS